MKNVDNHPEKAADSLGLKRTVSLGSAGAAIIAIAGLLGYLPGLRILACIRSDFVPMEPGTLFCFLIFSVALFRLARNLFQGFGRRVMITMILIVVAFCLLDVAGRFTERGLGLYGNLAPGIGNLATVLNRSASPVTSATLIVAGVGIFLLFFRSRNSRYAQRLGHWASILGVLTMLVGMTRLLAYLYAIPLMFRGIETPMAATAAAAFLFLGIALATGSCPDSLPMLLFAGESTSARLSRIFLPLTVVMVFLQSVLSQFVATSCLFNEAQLAAVLIIVTGTITAFVVSRISDSVGHTIDEVNKKLRESEERERRESQNRQLQKAESLKCMAGAIAHHFNNQLYAVMGNLEMAMEDLPRGDTPGANLAKADELSFTRSDR
jgi:hypothetical protein